jgi:hypothetical protein
MKNIRIFVGLAVVAVLLGGFMSCDQSINLDGDTGNDTTSPNISITSPLASPITIDSNIYLLSGVASDNETIEGVYLSRNSTSFSKVKGTITWSSNITDLAEGTNAINVYAKDTGGNTSTTQGVVIIVVTGAPIVLVNPAGSITTNTSFNVALSVDKDYGYYSTNNLTFTQFTTSGAIINITTNTTLKYYGSDGVNTSTTQTVVYTIDTVGTLSFTSPSGNISINSNSFLVVGDINDSDGFKDIYLSINDSIDAKVSISGLSWYTNIMGLSEGTNFLEVYAINSNNVKSDIAKVWIFVDSIAPTATITSPSGNITNTDYDYTVSGTASDSHLEGVYLSRNNSAFEKLSGTTSWTTNITDLATGSNIIEVYAKDNFGNISSTNSVLIWVSTDAPIVSVDPSTCISNELFTATLSTTKNYGYWSTNNSVFVQFTTSGANIDISEDTTLKYYGSDGAYTSTTQSIVYTVDTVAPTVGVGSLPANTNVNSFTVTTTISDNAGGTGIQTQYYKVDSGSPTTFTGSSFNVSGLSEGSRIIYVWAIDNANNSTTNSVTTTVDTTAPDAPTVTGDSSDDRTPTWSWYAVVSAVKYKYSYTDGSSWTETTDTNFTPTSDLSLGTYTLYVQACDSIGNWSTSGSKAIEVMPMFTEINAGTLTNVYISSIDLGDIDADGDLDLILTGDGGGGSRVSKIYQNNGSGGFTEINSGSLTDVSSGSVDLGDIDNDGDLDLILTGRVDGSTRVSEIYTNNGSGSFDEINSGDLTGVKNGSIKLGDINGDSKLDLILTGNDGSSEVSKIYQNDGSGGFTEINSGSLTNVSSGSVDLGDINGDSKLDLILTGNDGSSRVSKIYTNNGSGGFTEINSGGLIGVYNSSIDLGDIDGDGDLDLILTGYDGSSTRVSKIYQNDGSGSFGEINSGSLIGVYNSSIDLGDIDNDGDLDLILTGNIGSSRVSKIYTNNGSGGFGEIGEGSLTGVDNSSIGLGDIDGDGDLDLILTGYDGSSRVSKIYRNNVSNN